MPVAWSSEPPTSVALACRPVRAWRRQLVKQLDFTRGGPGTQPAERGVGVDGHHRVIVADLREARPCAGHDGGFADPGRAVWWSWTIIPCGVSWSCSNCVTIFTRTTLGDDG